jgi:hypothetical protein
MTMRGDVRLDAACDGIPVFEDMRARPALAPYSALTVFDRSVTNPAVAPRRRIFQHRGRNDSIASGQPVATQRGNDLRMEMASATLGWLARADRDTERVQKGPPEPMSRALGG